MTNPKVALISRSAFPYGNVSTSRYTTYCKALSADNIYTKVYVLHPSKTKEAKENRITKGVFEGINYEYLSKETYWEPEKSSLVKQLMYIFYVLKSFFLLRRDKIDTIILYHHDMYNTLAYRLFCTVFNITLVTDKTEYPYGYKNYNSFQKALMKFQLRRFDKYFVMTHELVKFYKEFLDKDQSRFYHLPVTVDSNKFSRLTKDKTVNPYIACVFGTHNRDCIFDTIKAYNIYQKTKGDDAFALYLFGNQSPLSDIKDIHKFISKEQLRDNVIFKGTVLSNKIPQILVNAKCLITTAREYSSGGFPTKLAEYLATSNPVIATNAGEIGLYLKDTKSCFLAQPANIKSISAKILFMHNNYEHSELVGKQGFKVASTEFNALYKIEKTINFLKKRKNLRAK